MRRPEQAQAWILYWEEMRDVPASSFTLSEYLPGRDFLCQSLWKDGALVLANTFERLSYSGGETAQVACRPCPRWPRQLWTLVSSTCVDAR